MHSDITYVAILVAFFVLMVGLVKACDHIIGSDEEAGDLAEDEATSQVEVHEEVAA